MEDEAAHRGGDAEGPCLCRRNLGWAVSHRLRAATREVVAQEHWLSSGLANTDLDLQLKKHGVRKVVVMGMRANTCIESTVRFAAELGYEVTLTRDAIGSFGVAERDASLQFHKPPYASAILPTDDLVAKLAAQATSKALERR